MDNSNNGARSPQDIALDLLKFVASHANLSKSTSSSTPGFVGTSSAPKPEDQVDNLLALYSRCREAVEK